MDKYFEGFPKEYIDFLWELRMNNNLEWFSENREKYNMLIKEPMKLFADEMTERLNRMGMGETFFPAVSRANRDIRFSKDKSPYKDRKWVVFNFGTGRWQEKCAFFFEISPEGWCMGMGIYDTHTEFVTKYRNKLSADLAGALKLEKLLSKQKEFVSDSRMYKRNYAPEGTDERLVKWYSYKNPAFVTGYKISDELFSRDILDEVEKGFKFLKPFFMYLKDIRG